MDPFDLQLDPAGKLNLVRPGQEPVADVRVRRAFPWSLPDQYISVRSSEGKELVLIERLGDLAPSQQELIRAVLSRWTLIPRIIRVHLIETRFGLIHWEVETDRGRVEFNVQEREDIRFLGDGRFSIKDADGNIYELPRIENLDEQSVRQVEAVL
jgi:hypothetical protein